MLLAALDDQGERAPALDHLHGAIVLAIDLCRPSEIGSPARQYYPVQHDRLYRIQHAGTAYF